MRTLSLLVVFRFQGWFGMGLVARLALISRIGVSFVAKVEEGSSFSGLLMIVPAWSRLFLLVC